MYLYTNAPGWESILERYKKKFQGEYKVEHEEKMMDVDELSLGDRADDRHEADILYCKYNLTHTKNKCNLASPLFHLTCRSSSFLLLVDALPCPEKDLP